MITNYESLAKELKKKGIRPSIQRVKVLDCLSSEDMHHTADEIYQCLLPEIPTLSKATIYNTLHAFTRAGLVRTVQVEGDEMRFDHILEDHGHFRCNQCGDIYDFEVNIAGIVYKGLEEFKVEGKDIHFKGLCPPCVKKNQKEKK